MTRGAFVIIQTLVSAISLETEETFCLVEMKIILGQAQGQIHEHLILKFNQDELVEDFGKADEYSTFSYLCLHI